MTISEYCDTINADISITRYHNQNERWCAQFDDCDIKDGCVLSSDWRDGKTPTEAINNYIKSIMGKRIVFNGFTKNDRREFDVPKNIKLY